MDYRTSHLSPGKGLSYEASFQRLPYRRIVWKWEQQVLHYLFTRIRREKRFIRYVDFACGTGRILCFAERYVDEALGIDVSATMLNVAADKVRRSRLVLGDLTKQQMLDENSVDIVTAFRFFLNAQPDLKEEALRAIGRALADDGYLIFNIHMNKGCVLERAIHAYRRIRNIQHGHAVSMSIHDVQMLLNGTNFEIIELYHYGLIPVSHEDQRFMIGFIDALERLLSRVSFLSPYSQYIIYVCKKRLM